MEEKKLPHRPTKYENREPSNINASIPTYFIDTFKKFVKLCEIDNSEAFIAYCKSVEEDEFDEQNNIINKKGKISNQGRVSKHLRWLITQYVIKNLYKLK